MGCVGGRGAWEGGGGGLTERCVPPRSTEQPLETACTWSRVTSACCYKLRMASALPQTHGP